MEESMTIRILTDSCCDLPINYIRENADVLDLIGMPIHVAGEDFIDDLGENTDLPKFYDKLRAGTMASTSQITPLTFETIFKKNHEEGAETIYLGLSSGLSGTMNNAMLARNMLCEEFENVQIHIPSTLAASVGQGLQIIYIIDMIRAGCTSEEILNWFEENKLKTQHWFAVDNLEYLKKGGRISPAAATIGTMLNIKPVLYVDNEGKLKRFQTVRGRKKSIKYLASKLKNDLEILPTAKVLIGHGNCFEDAETLSALIKDKISPKNIIISNLAHTIATHVGPDMLAIAFIGEERKE